MSTAIGITKLKTNPSKVWQWFGDFIAAFCGSIVIVMSAPISYVFPFTVVPVAIQGHVALLIGFLLGSKRGPLSVLMFLSYGAVGYPVFTAGGGIHYLIGPTGGYIVGYFIGVCMMRYFDTSSRTKTFMMFVAANSAFYLFGVAWLAGFIGYAKALKFGFLPFFAIDIVKNIILTYLVFLPGFNSTIKRLGSFG
ncbi:MAG: hypothetical protein S4CHLAM20_10490 [Chlamydiia bacterium]|nr:hypothetical protein [Chlamydiia bacterium]